MSETDLRSSEGVFQTRAPEFVYWSAVHTLADERLAFAVNSGILLTIFTGEAGTGKTTLAQKAVSDAQSTRLIGLCAYGPRIKVDPCRAILEAFGADPGPGDKALHLRVLQKSLGASQHDFVLPTLILDDAHLFSDEQLSNMFELAGFGEDQNDALFKIILIGHPELSDRLDDAPGALPGPFFTLEPMSKKDTVGYIKHRIAAADFGHVSFDDDAFGSVFERTGGIPQQINLLCQALLDKAVSLKTSKIDSNWVQTCKISSTQDYVFEQQLGLSVRTPAPYPNVEPESATVVEPPPTKATPTKGKPATEAKTDLNPTSPPGGPVSKPAAKLARSESVGIAKPGHSPVPTSEDEPKRGRLTRTALYAGLAGAASLALVAFYPADSPDQTDEMVASAAKPETRTTTEDNDPALAGNNQVANSVQPPIDIMEMAASSSDGTDVAAIENSVVQNTTKATSSNPSLDIVDTAPILAMLDVFDAPPEDIADWYRLGLSVADQNPRAAAVAYALAASRGHPRAAYFLGQMYELGEGVPFDTVLARIWYEKAAPQIERAAARLASLPEPQTHEMPGTPIQLFSFIAEDQEAVMVWTSSTGADPTTYSIDFGDLNGEVIVTVDDIASSVLRHTLPAKAVYWRARARSVDMTGNASSDWMPLDVRAHRATGSVSAGP